MDLSESARKLRRRSKVRGLFTALASWRRSTSLPQVGAVGAKIRLGNNARELEFKLEVFGENSCSRWHQDKYAGRAIVSYTGHVGTEYTSHANVDFWELNNCGNNACIIKQPDQVFAVDVGDMLFIKGTLFPWGSNGLVHKAPEKRYHSNGNIINRLVLKIDVPS